MINNKNNLITIIAGMIISSIIFAITLNFEIDKNKLYFTSEANNVFSKIESSFLTFNRINHELSSRFFLEDEINSSEFQFYAKSIIKQHNFIDEILFAENIPAKNKIQYEKALQSSGYTGFEMSSFENEFYTRPATEKYLLPIKFIEPYTVKNSLWFGKNLLTYAMSGNIISEKNTGSIHYVTNKIGDKYIYALQTLYRGQKYNSQYSAFKNIYGILIYKLNPNKLAATKISIKINLGNNVVLNNHIKEGAGIFDITNHTSKTINLFGKNLFFEFSQKKNISDINIIFPALLFIFSLMLTGFVWFVIHSHIQLNNILRKQNKIIENEVKIKTAELQVRAEELEAFSYSVSHDLRTPLNAIDGFSQLLLENKQLARDTNAIEYAQHISTASLKMGHIIDDLLKLAHVSRANFKKEYINISELIEQSIHTMREYDPDRDIELIIEKNVFALADKDFLQISFDNLISNAWKFTKQTDNPCIEFGTLEQDGILVYFVRDNGAGFNMREANKLFIAFQRLHQKNEFEGFGIGLSTVQRIIQKHNGEIWAESEVGKGATFYFNLGSNKNSL